MNYKFIKEVNWLDEAVNLGNLLYEFNTFEEIENLHISSNPKKYSVSMEKLDEMYAEVLQYKKACMKDAFIQFKMDREIEILSMQYEGEVSNFTILTSLSWFLDSKDISKISEEDLLRSLLLSLYNDSTNEKYEEGGYPHIREYRYKSSHWGFEEIHIEISDIIELLQMTKYNQEIKWTVLDLISTKEKREDLINKIRGLQSIIQKHFHIVENFYFETIDKYENDPKFLVSIQDLFGGFLDSFEYMNLEFSVIWYNAGSIKVIDLEEIENAAFIGIIITELMELSGYFEMKDENVIEKYKAIGDSTRFTIINLLAEKSMYLKELADALELSSATLSHHLNILLQNGFINVRVDDRKTFYFLKKDSFEELGQYLQMKANSMGDVDGN